MKFKSVLSFLIVCIFCFQQSFGQLRYIGLKNESNVEKAQSKLIAETSYWPKSKVIDEFVYVCSSNGIYRKSLNTITDTLWTIFAFEGIPIRDFVKHNDSILAITANINDSLLLMSTDNGATFTNRTSEYFFKYKKVNTIHSISMNPLNHNSILTLQEYYGVAKSTDFGANWKSLYEASGGLNRNFVGFNSNDTLNIIYTGETAFSTTCIFSSYNNGVDWKILSDSFPISVFQLLTFHPNDKNIIIFGGSVVAKSINQGLNWNFPSKPKMHITSSIIFNNSNSNILYASGYRINDTIEIFSSTDGGDNWKVFYQEPINNSEGIIDMQHYDNMLVLFTKINGIYVLDLNDINQSNDFQFEATVIGKGLDCGETFLISLNSIDDNSDIQDGPYYADQLNSEFMIPGLKIYLNCRKPNENEIYACTTMGPAYPHVIVTNSDIKELVNNGTKENSVLQLYPNPANDKIFIKNPTAKNLQVKIFQSSGKLAFEGYYSQNELIEIPISGFSAGIYLVKMETNNASISKKLLIE